MNYKPYFKGRVESGNLHVTRSKEFKDYIKKFEGKNIVLTIEPTSQIRTLSQNNYLWGVIYRIVSDDTGFSPPETHEVFKKKYLYYEKTYKGKNYGFTKSTTALSKKDFSEYVERIKAFAASELSLNIPNPEDVDVIY